MSYDLMVFEPEAAPKEHAAFMDWYGKVTEWAAGPYDDPERASARVQAWVVEMQRRFPDMNSVESADLLDPEDGCLSDYTIGREFCYAGFAWAKTEEADAEARRLAGVHGLGFFECSGSEEGVYLPSGGGLVLAHRKRAASWMERLRRKLGGG